VLGATSAAACDTPHSIYSPSLNLYVCAESSILSSPLILKSDFNSRDSSNLNTCWWYATSSKVYLSGSTGLLMDSQDFDVCSGSSFKLAANSSSASSQLFGWIKTSLGYMLVNGGGSGPCAMESANIGTGPYVYTSAANSGGSQSYVRRALSCSNTPGSYWNQDVDYPQCLQCPLGRRIIQLRHICFSDCYA
jgi:hypothetical protein